MTEAVYMSENTNGLSAHQTFQSIFVVSKYSDTSVTDIMSSQDEAKGDGSIPDEMNDDSWECNDSPSNIDTQTIYENTDFDTNIDSQDAVNYINNSLGKVRNADSKNSNISKWADDESDEGQFLDDLDDKVSMFRVNLLPNQSSNSDIDKIIAVSNGLKKDLPSIKDTEAMDIIFDQSVKTEEVGSVTFCPTHTDEIPISHQSISNSAQSAQISQSPPNSEQHKTVKKLSHIPPRKIFSNQISRNKKHSTLVEVPSEAESIRRIAIQNIKAMTIERIVRDVKRKEYLENYYNTNHKSE